MKPGRSSYLLCLFFILVSSLITKESQARWVQTNGPPGGIIECFAVSGADLFAGTEGRGVRRRPLAEMTNGVESIAGGLPSAPFLHQNYPNPFNPTNTIENTLPHAGDASLRVYNVLGEEVATLVEGDHAAGAFKATWNASDMPSGVYFPRLSARGSVQAKKMVMMK